MQARHTLRVLAVGSILLFAHAVFAQTQSANAASALSPPVAPVKAVVDDYFGTKVSDPYRYMENLKDPEVEAWFKGQNEYTRAILAKIPGRAKLLSRIRELDQSVPRVFAGRLPGDVYLIFKRLPNEDTEKIYLRNGLKGTDRLLVDPEKIKLAPEDQAKGKNEATGSRSVRRWQAIGGDRRSRRFRNQWGVACHRNRYGPRARRCGRPRRLR